MYGASRLSKSCRCGGGGEEEEVEVKKKKKKKKLGQNEAKEFECGESAPTCLLRRGGLSH